MGIIGDFGEYDIEVPGFISHGVGGFVSFMESLTAKGSKSLIINDGIADSVSSFIIPRYDICRLLYLRTSVTIYIRNAQEYWR